jgi:hypothetical protein
VSDEFLVKTTKTRVKLPNFCVKTRNLSITGKKAKNLLLNSKTVFTFIAAYATNRFILLEHTSGPNPSIKSN